MKVWHVVVAVVVLAQAFGWINSCRTLGAERKQYREAWAAYRADSASWAKRNRVLVDSLVELRQDSARLAGDYHAARRAGQTAAERLRMALFSGARDSQPVRAALDTVLRAGEACDLLLTNCEARAATEKQRADEATAGRLRADAAAATANARVAAEIRHGRAWNPFSLKPPSLLWAAGLFLAGGLLLQ